MLKAVLIGSVAVLAVLAIAQAVLPRLAERHLRSELAGTGQVRDVTVHAFPAVKVLWGRADHVVVRMGEAQVGAGKVEDLVKRTRGAARIDASATRARLGPLLLRDLRLDKRGDELAAEATITESDLASALPPTIGLRPAGADADGLLFEASTGILGLRATLRARVSVRDGAIVIAPDLPLGGLVSMTVFSAPVVDVTAVGARPRSDGFTLTAQGRLAG